MTTVLPRGTLERADQGAPSALGAVQCNLARTVANQSVRVEDFQDTVFRPSKNASRMSEALSEKGSQTTCVLESFTVQSK
ncbi:hypothetical protein HAV15_008901 [Penicillium sp. str. |uniref:Uncharacterized protein n=1 Tax=Penicillium cf. viridicatum TaxID=2972119 RepID=A0A9W9MJU7_9EURO|nr:hypothetical protein HAV15_008901 [Penicillium sp. str. \